MCESQNQRHPVPHRWGAVVPTIHLTGDSVGNEKQMSTEKERIMTESEKYVADLRAAVELLIKDGMTVSINNRSIWFVGRNEYDNRVYIVRIGSVLKSAPSVREAIDVFWGKNE